MKIVAAMSYGPEQPLRIEAAQREEPRPDEVLVKMVAVIDGERTIKGIDAGDGDPDIFVTELIDLLGADDFDEG